ncbi:LysR family transcriptional regulator [Neorhizobium sp. T7_12]|uniref:LysR family transcriptional regulator n=1 Tax=Neorhizobium sp. T7_12 TaxID=2093832 RepID=UPI000CF9E3BD|nr:LysR family transcriptional regulator [Neorhizobium sp. T7_12]
MERLDDLEAFLAIGEKGSQTAAARHLRRSLQSINRSLAALEQSVGVELVRRTTRRSYLTEAGRAFYDRVKPALAEIHDARLEAADARSEPTGLLRIAAPVLFAPAYVVPAITAFMQHYPGIEIQLKVSDRMVDLLEEGLDLAVRIRDMADSSLKARRLGDLRAVVFGSPDYFAKYGRPEHPDDLTQHQCVLRHAEGSSETWTFRIGGRRKAVRVHGRFGSDSAAATHAAVASGLGIGLTPLWQIRSLVDEGAVEVVLEEFEDSKIPIYAVWPSGKIPLAKTRLFVDELAARLKRERL